MVFNILLLWSIVSGVTACAADPVEKKLEICSLAPENWVSLKELRLQAAKENPLILGVTEGQEEERSIDFYHETILKQSAYGERRWMRFARCGNEYIGFIDACGQMPNESLRSHQATIVGLYVMKKFRTKTVDTSIEYKLLAELISVLHDIPRIKSMAVLVPASDPRMQTVYTLHGFARTGHSTYGLMLNDDFYEQKLMEKRMVDDEYRQS